MDPTFKGQLNFNRLSGHSSLMEVDGDDSVIILEHLGSGAQGMVFSGLYNSEMVAVKVQMPGSQADPNIDKTFFDHPSVVKSLATGVTNNIFVKKIVNVMELATPLNASIFGKYDGILTLAKHILEGLDYMHSLGYSHCDVKPDNIVVLKRNQEYRFALCDLDMTIDVQQPQKDYKHSSLYYMDPHTIRNYTYSLKGDIFSLGCTLFQLATGRYVWGKHDSDMSFLCGIYYGAEKYYIDEIEHEDFDATLCQLIKSCLKPLSERPSARDLLQELMQGDETMLSQDE